MAGGISGEFRGKMQSGSMPASFGGNGAAISPPNRAQKISRTTLYTGMTWLTVIVASTFLMLGYANSPGTVGSPPVNWPASSSVPHATKHPTLVMFIHPRCPCSRASIGELAELMAHCQGQVNAHVFFLKPAGMPEDWAQTDTWREAAAIPGVTVHQDDSGWEAKLFNVETSGDLVLYDAKGQLTFHGGITAARGHFGDNSGESTVQALLLNQPAQINHTPVFGCSLFNCPTQTTR
jgi:hypothetical protein